VIKGIYAIRDVTAQSVVGGLHLFVAPAAAIRFFGDIASDPQTMVSRHILDHELICCGALDEETGAISQTGPDVVISGAAWKAAQTPTEEIK
jgi:hypothetical protein